MKRFLSLLIALICLTATYAQEKKQSIWGIISDGVSTVQGVNISIDGTDFGTFSDKNGEYNIEAKPSDVLEFSYVGMQTVKVIVEDVTRILNIQLSPKFEQLDEVVVTKSKRKTQADLAVDYAIDKTIVNTSFGYISPETSAYRIGVIDGSELSNAAFDILSAIQGKLPGMRIQTYKNPRTRIEERTLFMGSGGSMRGSTPAVFEVDGTLYADIVPTWIDINNVERIGVLSGLQATWRFGSIAAGGVVFINTKNGAHGVKEDVTGLPYDRAKLRNNILRDDALSDNQLTKNEPTYLMSYKTSTSIEKAKSVYQENLKRYFNSPYFLIDSYSYFIRVGEERFAADILDKNLSRIDKNAVHLKALAYNAEANGAAKTAKDLYEQVFVLRPNYAQSYRDLAESYRETKNYKKAASMYARYNYLVEEGLLHSDSLGLGSIIDRDSENLLALEGDRVMENGKLETRLAKYTEFDGTRLLFEWNDSEAEFELQFVNPEKHYHAWKHTSAANAARIMDEKLKGYSSEEFLIDGSLPGKWQVNINYKGNKKLEPTYLKVTSYFNYGLNSQRKEVNVYRLSLKDVNHKLFDIVNSGRIHSN